MTFDLRCDRSLRYSVSRIDRKIEQELMVTTDGRPGIVGIISISISCVKWARDDYLPEVTSTQNVHYCHKRHRFLHLHPGDIYPRDQ